MTQSHIQNTTNTTETDTFAKAIALRLTQASESLPHSITERLKAARMLAMEKRQIVVVRAAAYGISSNGHTAALQGPYNRLWGRIGAAFPILALVAGLVLIHSFQNDMRAQEAAEVDAELLTDDLPPDAFTDPGFVQFLRANTDSGNSSLNP